ncbi:UNVERIFIED_CONTAM: CubicO group peptidase (beta-lactamase class C family) [Acetivibrio alkalicellulosi]
MAKKKDISIHNKNLKYRPEDVGYIPQRLEQINAHLANLIENRRIQSAAYIISKDDKIFTHCSMGKLLYNNDQKEFMPDSIRRIASITKLFVAVCILQLVEDGKIRLDQQVSEIIKEFDNDMFQRITIFHLLTHTSGIRPDPGTFLEPYPLEWKWLGEKEWIKESLRDSLLIEPGKEWRYSSTGFTILAEIVSRVSGIHFEKYVMKKITKPLGMNTTFFDIPNELVDKICFSSEFEMDWFKKRTDRKKWSAPRGGGGLFSTLEDLQKFGQMLINKGTLKNTRILSRKTIEAMTRNHTKGVVNYCWNAGGIEMEYGLGMNVYSNNTFLSPGSFSHEGAGLCGLYMDPVENVVFAYMCSLVDDIVWEPEAVINLRNIVWSGIV